MLPSLLDVANSFALGDHLTDVEQSLCWSFGFDETKHWLVSTLYIRSVGCCVATSNHSPLGWKLIELKCY